MYKLIKSVTLIEIFFRYVFNFLYFIQSDDSVLFKEFKIRFKFIIKYKCMLNIGLSEQEMLLFSESIEICNKIISPMIRRYTWKRLDIDNYLLDCFDELESV